MTKIALCFSCQGVLACLGGENNDWTFCDGCPSNNFGVKCLNRQNSGELFYSRKVLCRKCTAEILNEEKREHEKQGRGTCSLSKEDLECAFFNGRGRQGQGGG